VDLLPGTVARLARNPRIVAVKDATASLSRARETLNACPPEFTLLSGDDATAVELMSLGARGSYRCRPTLPLVACTRPAKPHFGGFGQGAGDRCQLAALHKDLFIEASPIPVKWAVARMGLIGNAIDYHWSNCQRRIRIPCCAQCGRPESPLRTKQHEI